MKDPKRHEPRHLWYLWDAQTLIQQLQVAVWPTGYHVALGGGVLNQGYSDNDLDLYILPLTREADEAACNIAIRGVLQYERPIGVDNPRYARGDRATVAMSTSDVYTYGDKRVDIFVVKPICQCELVTARLLGEPQ